MTSPENTPTAKQADTDNMQTVRVILCCVFFGRICTEPHCLGQRTPW